MASSKRTETTLGRCNPSRTGFSLGHRVFLTSLAVTAGCYGVIVTCVLVMPRRQSDDPSAFGQSKPWTVANGLLPSGDTANDARAYLRAVKPQALSESLSTLLADPKFKPQATQEHRLLGQVAPDFTLRDDRGKSHQLHERLQDGPVVVVFYYGYHCSHCVAQLFGLNEDLGHFRELGANVVALSADSAEVTAARFAQYGRFDFPVLSDDRNRIAEAYGVFRPATESQVEDLRHGTFLIGADGRVLWAYAGEQPFVDNKSLLFLLAADQRARTISSLEGEQHSGKETAVP